MILAALDTAKAFEASEEGGSGLLIAAYLTSGIGGLCLTVAIFFGAAFPVIVALVALLVAVGIFIEFIKDDPLQDWLERCPWGVLPNQRYLNVKIEQEQLAQAFK